MGKRNGGKSQITLGSCRLLYRMDMHARPTTKDDRSPSRPCKTKTTCTAATAHSTAIFHRVRFYCQTYLSGFCLRDVQRKNTDIRQNSCARTYPPTDSDKIGWSTPTNMCTNIQTPKRTPTNPHTQTTRTLNELLISKRFTLLWPTTTDFFHCQLVSAVDAMELKTWAYTRTPLCGP